MGGLIGAAKAKIWYIANQIIAAEPRPDVAMALVAYRDKGDDYVTRVYDLTDNIDKVYSDLMGFSASGGGDGPEHVNKGLSDAVHSLGWSKDDKTLKVIYLVGDYPPHNEYSDTPKYAELAKAAIEKGIYVNTILCGGNTETAAVWQEIARAAEGEYFAIAQDGGVVEIATPYDEELSRLNTEMVDTVVVYGTAAEQSRGRKLNVAAGSMSAPAAAAERADFAAKSGRAGTQDLVAAVQNGDVKLADLDEDHLSPEMREMNAEERAKYLAAQQTRRAEITAQITRVSRQRAEYMKKELEKTDGAKDGFDAKVVETIQAQGARKGINYK
jgi:hypothetical protein